MILVELISSFCLLSSAMAEPLPQPVQQAIQVIQQHHLETPEGRVDFLIRELAPFVEETEQLNQEVQELARQIESMDPEDQSILSSAEILNAKMALLGERLPLLKPALQVDEDFQKLDTILAKKEPLDESEKELLLRVASLCNALESSFQ